MLYQSLNHNGQIYYYSFDPRNGINISFYKKVQIPRWKFIGFRSKEMIDHYQYLFNVDFSIEVSHIDHLRAALNMFYNASLMIIDEQKIKENP